MPWSFRAGLIALLACLVSPLSANAGQADLQTVVVPSNSGPASVELRLSLGDVTRTRANDGFDVVNAPGLVPMDAAGLPDVPVTGSLIAVPNGFTPVVLSVHEAQTELAGSIVAPAQKKFRCATPGRETFEFDAALYDSEEIFPARGVEIEEVGILAGVKLARIALHPIRVDFARKATLVSTKMVVRVGFKANGEARTPVTVSKEIYGLLRGATANVAFLNRDVQMATGAETLVIVTGDAYKTTIEPLVKWKKATGLKVDVFTLTEAGGTKEKVKEHLQKYYDAAAKKPAYFLFVGNKDTMPAFNEPTGSGQAASDIRYAQLAGNDAIPDVLYGRILGDNAAEVTLHIDRLLAYEQHPDKGATWYPQGMTIASNEGSNPSDKEYGDQVQAALKAHTYKTMDTFLQGDSTATSSNISKALDEGRTWIAYFGHGSGTSWGSTTDSFSNETIGTLTNGGKLPAIIDVACQNASWVKIKTCFGKKWVTHTAAGKPAGAVAFYGGSVNISWHPPAVMSVGVAKAHFEKPVHTIGGSVLGGQLYLIEKMGSGASSIDNLKWYNLFGDPSMMIRTNTPLAYNVTQNIVKRDGRLEVTVTAKDMDGKGVANIQAALAAPEGSLLAVGKTTAEGKAVLTVEGITALEPESVLTTTGYNAETKTTTVQ